MVNTVEGNASKFSNSDYRRAELARRLQRVIMRPSDAKFNKILRNNLLVNCPITSQDAKNAEAIFGPDVGSLKGKTVWRRPDKVVGVATGKRAPRRYRNVTIVADIMEVNKVKFLVTVSRHIKMHTIEVMETTTDHALIRAFKRVISQYWKGGFKVEYILGDNRFKSLDDDLEPTVNPTSNDEHSGDIERAIRTIKERMRAVVNTLPFEYLPRSIIRELGLATVFWINSFPAEGGISDTQSPRELVTGRKIDFNKHCK